MAFGRGALACRVCGRDEVPQRTCFASETSRKVEALGVELVRCFLHCCLWSLGNRHFAKKRRNHFFSGEEKVELSLRDIQFIKRSLAFQALRVHIDTGGLLVGRP